MRFGLTTYALLLLLCSLFSLSQAPALAQATAESSRLNLKKHNPKLNIALMTWRGITKAEQGFQDQLKALNYDVNYDLFNAQQNKTTLVKHLRGPFSQNIHTYHYVYSFGTTVSTSVFTINRKRIPHIYNIVTYPQQSGLTYQDNTAGGSHNVPLMSLLSRAQKIKPFKTLGFFFNAREKNSMQILNELFEISKTLQFQLTEFRSPAVPGIIEKNLELLKKIPNPPEAFYFPNDSHIIANRDIILDVCIELGLFTISPQYEFAQSGAVFTLAPDFYRIGKKVAYIVDQHQKGTPLIDIPIQYDDQPRILVSQRGLKASGLQLPSGIAEKAEYLP